MDAKELGRFIAAMRKEKQMTQAELAQRLHVTDKAVSRWERGLGFPDINTLEPLADALGITLTELMRCSKGAEEDSDAGIQGAESDSDSGIQGAENDSDAGIRSSIEIAQVQRKETIKKIMMGGLGSVIGICMMLYAVKMFMARTWTLSIGGSDGPTAVFVAGKIGRVPPLVIGTAGVIILVCGIFTILRSSNHDH